MEMSLIGSSPAKFPTTRGGFCHVRSNTDNNNPMMVNTSIATKSQMCFRQIISCRNLPLRVTAQSATSGQASQKMAISDHKDGVKLYVGLPLDSISECNAINHSRAIAAGLRALKLLGVEGVELPIWWGVAEREAMGKYEWSGYLALVDMIQKSGLKIHVSLCFHASKEENISLPKWVTEIGESKPDIFFADRSGKHYKECLSFGVDNLPVFYGKTAIQVYQGFIESFKAFFLPYMGSTITGVTIGMGPDGELQYPSYHDQTKNSVDHGAGEFQCYDENMMSDLKENAESLGNPLWGLSGPHDAPSYNQQPIFNTFFKEGGSWETAYGDFFLSWYSNHLLSHADRMLSLAASSFSDSKVMGVTIGMGPDGELQYPSYHDQTKNSVDHGAGEFQCYDENMMSDLKENAESLGNPLWGLSGPHDAPSYNQQPIFNTFFKEGGSWETAYGDFFLSWYSNHLLSHADRMLSLAASSFSDSKVMVSGKLPLIHSWYRSRSHPAEVTAGFYNTVNRNGYEEIVKIFCKNSCRMILPGMDLLDELQPNELFSSPELLLADIRDACRKHGVEVSGQNLHVAGTVKSFEQIKKNLFGENGIKLFLYQRMGGEFFSPENFPLFSAFVRGLNQLDLDSDDLGVNEREGAVFVPGMNRKLQAV